LELQRFFGDKYDMSLLDYKSGKISQVVWRKQRRLKSMATNITSAAKYDTYLNLPVRQTASIFKQPVNVVTNNHKNEPTPASVLNANVAVSSANQPGNNNVNNTNNAKPSEKSKPVQLFWELRFDNLKATDPNLLEDISDGLVQQDSSLSSMIQQELELSKIAKFKNFPITNETALRSVAVSCYLNPNKILIGQDNEFTKNARVYIDRDQPLIPAVSIKEEDIKQQEAKLKEIRKKLQLAIEDLENMDLDEYFLDAEKPNIESEHQESDLKDVKKLKVDLTENKVDDDDDDIIIEEDEEKILPKVESKLEPTNEHLIFL
jgi:hypothetical protein